MWYFFLIFSMVLGLLDQLQIFLQMYQIELLRILTGLGLLELQHLIYTSLLTEFGMLVFFTNLSPMSYGISGQIFGLISSCLSNRQLRVVLDDKLHKNIQLMGEFLKVPFLVLHFSYYKLMTFLMMLSVILLSMLMMLLSTRNFRLGQEEAC